MKINGKSPRALTLAEVRQCREPESANEADVVALSLAYDTDMTSWFATASAGHALAAIAAVWEASGLTEGAQFSDS